MIKFIIPAIIVFLIVLFWEKINEIIYKKFNLKINYIITIVFLIVLITVLGLAGRTRKADLSAGKDGKKQRFTRRQAPASWCADEDIKRLSPVFLLSLFDSSVIRQGCA